MLYFIAAGKHIDTDRTERFGAQVDRIHRNPFKKEKPQPRTAREIKDYIVGRIKALLHGG